jgi:uncharacterized protein (DUF983 family)
MAIISASPCQNSKDANAGLLSGMKIKTRISTFSAILRQMCPRCRSARIFRKSIFTGFPGMLKCCPNCSLKFEREQGYFLGAMYISYGLALMTITALGLLLWASTSWSLQRITLWAILLFLPLAPSLTLFSRVLWIYLDQAIDPE